MAIFLSYARDDAAAARQIAGTLRHSGLEVWFDENELRGGDAWDAKIREQVETCALFLPIVSAHTQARREGYFRLEWNLADQRTHLMAHGTPFLMPVVIDDTKERGALVPKSFLAVQWTRMPGGDPPVAFVQRVRALVGMPGDGVLPAEASAKTGRWTEDPPLPSLPPGKPKTGGQQARRISAKTIFLGAATVLVIAVAGWKWLSRQVGAVAPGNPLSAAAKPPPDLAAKSVAVLPFANLSAEPTDAYLSDGLTEELVNALCKVKGLRVPGRGSSFAFRGRTGENIFREVGEKLHVSWVLEGSLRRVGDKIRITAQLVNVADGFHLWSETYNGDLPDILSVQSEVAQKVVQALQLKLGVDEASALAKKPTGNAEAHRLYLLGRFHFAKTTSIGIVESIRYFNEALRLDPAYALAYCGLADTYGFMGGIMPGREAWAKEKELARKALALDPGLPEAHFSLGLGLASGFEWVEGEKEIKRAIAMKSNQPLAYDQYAFLLTALGRHDEAIANSKIAVSLDPLSPEVNAGLCWWSYYARRFPETIAQAGKTLEFDPESPVAHVTRGWCLLWGGDKAGGIAEFERATKADPFLFYVSYLGYAYAVSGERAKAEKILRDFENLAKQGWVSPGVRVYPYLGLGEKEKAYEWLEKSCDEQDYICALMKVDPAFDGIRSEPRFQVMLKRMGLDR